MIAEYTLPPRVDPRIKFRCDTPGCGQVLATLYHDGGGKPHGAVEWDKDGRLVIICPSCNERKRLPIRRRG